MSARDLIQSERVRVSLERRQQGMATAERHAEVTLSGAFLLLSVVCLLLWGVSGSFSLPVAATYVIGIALAGHIHLHTGAGFTVPIQAVFVPMLFQVPLTLVAPLVAVALALSMIPAILSGEMRVSRLLSAPANAWFALGPVIVLLVGHDHDPQGQYGLLVLAVLAQLVVDFAANFTRELLRGEINVGELFQELREVYLIDLALAPLGLAIALVPIEHGLGVLLILPLFWLLRGFSKDRTARLTQLVELNEAYRGTALVLGDVVEADDAYTGEHCKSVVRLALDVALHLGLDLDCQRKVEFGALLHDVGKIAVPKEIINKPGALDEREWEIIKTHTIEGQRILERVGGIMLEVGRIVRSSHEHWDGRGYPDGLVGEQIPLESRIVATCDAFNAMTTTRSYRKAMAHQDAINELRAHAGTQFDPQVVDALISVVKVGQQVPADQGSKLSVSLQERILPNPRSATA